MTLEYLKSLIPLAAVMLGVSLLIAILTQMVSALFGLRGANLLWGLNSLIATVDQRLVDQAEVVLRRPLVSDPAFSPCDRQAARPVDARDGTPARRIGA